MMVADTKITAFKNVINDATITDADTEDIFDAAIMFLSACGAKGLSKMAGAAGSKTVTLTVAQEGAVQFWARCIYGSYFKNAPNSNVNAGSVSVNVVLDLMSNATTLSMGKFMARQLNTKNFQRA
jgi:hypothetical protein